MRLLELEIKNIRGIKHLTVKPAGDNLVIWGPNGSGKSAVVDSIDFLLTGRIQHLTGSGTRDITLSKHGSHIDHTPKDTWVRAIIQLPNSKKQVELKRCMHEPNKLKYNINGDKEIHKVLMFAEQGLHILSRREILKYITANSNTRAQEIQELLNIGELEDTRKALVKVKNNFITKLSNL